MPLVGASGDFIWPKVAIFLFSRVVSIDAYGWLNNVLLGLYYKLLPPLEYLAIIIADCHSGKRKSGLRDSRPERCSPTQRQSFTLQTLAFLYYSFLLAIRAVQLYTKTYNVWKYYLFIAHACLYGTAVSFVGSWWGGGLLVRLALCPVPRAWISFDALRPIFFCFFAAS